MENGRCYRDHNELKARQGFRRLIGRVAGRGRYRLTGMSDRKEDLSSAVIFGYPFREIDGSNDIRFRLPWKFETR